MPTSRAAHGAPFGKGTVLARVIANILSGAAQQGMSRDMLLEASGLRAVDFGDPEARVPSWAEVALWQLIARRAADPGVGIRMGAGLQAREWGLLGYAFRYSSTLSAALRRLTRYGRILNEAIQFEINEAAGYRLATASWPAALGGGLPYAVSFRFAAVLNVSRQITRTDVVPSEIAFAHEQPASTLEYRRFFRCPLRFGQVESTITFAKRDVELPVPGGDEALARYLSEGAERVLRTLCSGSSTSERARAAIWAALSEGPPRLRQMASALQMPPRTLQRHLAAEGTSLHAEVEHIREQMALATLRDRTMPIEEVAFILGYAEPSTFYRSFKRWTGKTPHRYRAAAADQR